MNEKKSARTFLPRSLVTVLFLFSLFAVTGHAGVRLELSSSPASLSAAGGFFDAAVKLVADEGQSYDALQVRVLFDPSVLEAVSLSVDSTKLPVALGNEINNALGRVSAAQGLLGDSTTGSFTFATIRFRALQESRGSLVSIDWKKASDSPSLVTLEGADVITGVSGMTLVIGDFPTPTPTPAVLPSVTPSVVPSVSPGPSPAPSSGPSPSPGISTTPTGAASISPSASAGGGGGGCDAHFGVSCICAAFLCVPVIFTSSLLRKKE